MGELILRGPTSPASSRWNGLKAVVRNRLRRRVKGLAPRFFSPARGSSKVPLISVSSGLAFDADCRYFRPNIRGEKSSIARQDQHACGVIEPPLSSAPAGYLLQGGTNR